MVGRIATRQLLLGMVYGALLIMAGYHLLLYATLRQRSSLLLALYSLAVMGTYAAANGHGQRYLWPNYPGAYLHAVPLTVGLAGLLLLLLTMETMETRQRAPRLHTLLAILAVAVAVTLPLVWIVPFGVLVAVQYALLAPAVCC